MRFGVTSTTPATRRRNLLGEDRKSGVAHTGKVAGRLLADFAFRYDAAGRLVKEGDRTYRYGYLDKVISVSEGDRTYTYDYHVDGQLARAVYGNGTGDDGRAVSTKPPPPASSEDFLWDGLALIKRGDERFVNEPHVGGGNPIASSKGTTYFNDILGTTVGIREGRAPSRPKSPRYSAAALTAFGESIPASQPLNTSTSQHFFTGKPHVAGLGHAFLFRNYRASLAKWQTADPLGYPDGWNQLAYCGNRVKDSIDHLGAWCTSVHHDINENWLTGNGIALYNYSWGVFSLNVLGEMNAASDWTDSLSNQADGRAYLHAMRSSNQQPYEAFRRWLQYLGECESQALDYARKARACYAGGLLSEAYYLENMAITYVGRMVHTYDDSFSPSHSNLQEFSYSFLPAHIAMETQGKYESLGFREEIYAALNAKYLSTLRKVLRQPE